MTPTVGDARKRRWRVVGGLAAAEPQHVLIVEDEPPLAELYCEAVRSAGLRCTVALSVDEALGVLQRERPDLVVTDMKFAAGVDGVRVLAAARTLRLPFVAMTGSAEAVDDLERVGIPHLRKPFLNAELLNAIHNELEHKASLR
jgi:CheY-like chemotaxis protein